MTAAGSSGAASPVCSPAHSHSSQSQAPSACGPATCWRHKRKERLLQTRLHLRSAPGVWLLLGVGVVLVGMSVAVAGYVISAPRPAATGRGSSHADRMKLAGPVVMGVGLFVFICAATLLYENRDRELLRLVASDDLEDLKPEEDNGWMEDSEEQHGGSCREEARRESVDDMEQGSCSISSHAPRSLSSQNLVVGPPLSPRNRRNINSSSPEGQRGPWETPPPPENGEAQGGREGPGSEGNVEEGKGEGGSTRLTRVLHHQEPTSCYPSSHCPSPSLSSSLCSDSCNSSEINFNIRTGLPANDGQ